MGREGRGRGAEGGKAVRTRGEDETIFGHAELRGLWVCKEGLWGQLGFGPGVKSEEALAAEACGSHQHVSGKMSSY